MALIFSSFCCQDFLSSDPDARLFMVEVTLSLFSCKSPLAKSAKIINNGENVKIANYRFYYIIVKGVSYCTILNDLDKQI